MTATATMGARRPSVNSRNKRNTPHRVKPAESWWAQVRYRRRKRGSGYVVRVGRKLGQLSFCLYESRPLPDEAQAHCWAGMVRDALENKRPVPNLVWWTWRVVPRRVGQGKEVYVGTVHKWLGASSYVWREIAPCDSREEAERIAKQTVQAGIALEGYPLRRAKEMLR